MAYVRAFKRPLVSQGPIFMSLGLQIVDSLAQRSCWLVGRLFTSMWSFDYIQGYHWFCKMGLHSAADSSVIPTIDTK